MEVKASANFTRMAPRKMRLLADMLRGKKAAAALDILEFSTRWARTPLLKLLNSAIANAVHNFNLQKENLYIKTIEVNQGPMLKRWSARAFGRAGQIQKKTSHIIIVLDEAQKEALIEKEMPAMKEKAAAINKKEKVIVKKNKNHQSKEN